MPSNYGLEYMPGGAKYGLNSPFTTGINPPKVNTTNIMGYGGMSGTNSLTYSPIPGVATVDNPGTFVPSQPMIESTPTQRSTGGLHNGFVLNNNVGGTSPIGQPTNTNAGFVQNASTTGQPTGNSFGFNPITGINNNGTDPTTGISTQAPGQTFGNSFGAGGAFGSGKQPYQQSSSMPQQDSNGLGYISPHDAVVDAMANQQRSRFAPQYNPMRGLFKIGGN